MSSWWEYDFSVVGKWELVTKVKEEITREPGELPEGEKPYFHYQHIVHEATGFLCVHASRNYGGCDRLLALADKYPELAFAGKVEHEQQCVDGTYYIVRAHNGYEYARSIQYDGFDPDADNWRDWTAEDALKAATDYDRPILWLIDRRDATNHFYPEVPDIIDVIKAHRAADLDPTELQQQMQASLERLTADSESEYPPKPGPVRTAEEVREIIARIKASSGDKVASRQGGEQ